MDPVTIAVGALLLVFTTAGGFIFKRQEDRIKALEEREAGKDAQHSACREEVAVLRARVVELRTRVVELEREVAELKKSDTEAK